MGDDWVIKVENVSKKFCKSLKRSMAYGFTDSLKNMVGLDIHEERLRKSEFLALQNISFELKKGESLGLIGRNGCGKSTLLRLINGIYPPSSGKITIKGRMGALIAVGAGFHPHMSGRENIYLNGTILGMSRTEITQKIDAIIDFAEIDDFIDAPVSTYSSGMTVRLGFAIAVHANIDILLADEVLAVGDMKFVAKCFNKLGQLRDQGVSIILVTHDTQNIISFCDQAILIDRGVILASGKTAQVVNKYFEHTGALLLTPKHRNDHGVEKGEVIVADVDGFKIVEIGYNPLPDSEGKIKIEYGSSITSSFRYQSERDIGEIEFHAAVSLDIPGPRFYITSNRATDQPIIISKGTGVISITIEGLNMSNVEASLTFSLWRKGMKECLYWSGITEIIAQKVEGSRGFIHYPVRYRHSQL